MHRLRLDDAPGARRTALLAALTAAGAASLSRYRFDDAFNHLRIAPSASWTFENMRIDAYVRAAADHPRAAARRPMWRGRARGAHAGGGRGRSAARALAVSRPSLVAAMALALLAPAAAAQPARFAGSVTPARAEDLRASWRPGCPVHFRDLRVVTARHWGMDRAVHTGRLVVHADHARGMLRVLRTLFDARFPIARMEPVDVFDGDDHRSMDANNTSAFNCREVAGRPGVWSEHAYGRAIDLNPVQNPYVEGGHVSPPAGAAYVDRARPAPGLVVDGDVVVRAFAAIGWRWGGLWRTKRDYQHFSATGR